MSLLADHNAHSIAASVTAWRGESTSIDVLELLNISDEGATVHLVNFNGTALNWLGTPHGAAYVVRDRVIFDGDSAGETVLEVRACCSDGSERNASIHLRVQ